MFYNVCKGAMWAIFVVVLMTMAGYAHADGVVGATVSQLGDDVSWGGHGHAKVETGVLDWDFDVIAQGGAEIQGKSNINVSVPVAGIDVGVFTKHNFRGYSVSDLGRTSDIGLKAGKQFGGVTASLGVFGRNGGVFGSPNALKTLEDAGYDVDALAGLGLGDVAPAPTGSVYQGRQFSECVGRSGVRVGIVSM